MFHMSKKRALHVPKTSLRNLQEFHESSPRLSSTGLGRAPPRKKNLGPREGLQSTMVGAGEYISEQAIWIQKWKHPGGGLADYGLKPLSLLGLAWVKMSARIYSLRKEVKRPWTPNLSFLFYTTHCRQALYFLGATEYIFEYGMLAAHTPTSPGPHRSLHPHKYVNTHTHRCARVRKV